MTASLTFLNQHLINVLFLSFPFTARKLIIKQATMMIKTPGYGSNCGASCVGSCGKYWERQGNSCYYFSTGKQSWFEAEKFCQQNGVQLASVTDAQGYYFINGKGVQVWIGGISEPGNDTWVWTDCSLWNFQKWQSGEPKIWEREKCVAHNAHIHDKK